MGSRQTGFNSPAFLTTTQPPWATPHGGTSSLSKALRSRASAATPHKRYHGSFPQTSANTVKSLAVWRLVPRARLFAPSLVVSTCTDICNGCAYCVISCPFGVVQKNEDDGRAFKCTFCTDRQKAGLEPACAKACPTESIKFGRLDDLREETQRRLEVLHGRGMSDARAYDPVDTSVKGIHSIFILRGEPETYNLPPKPEVPTIYLKDGWRSAAFEAVAMVAAVAGSFLLWRNTKRIPSDEH